MAVTQTPEFLHAGRVLITAKEVAQMFGLSEDAVWKAARDSVLPVVYVGRRMRFDRERLMEWVAAGGQALPSKEAVAN